MSQPLGHLSMADQFVLPDGTLVRHNLSRLREVSKLPLWQQYFLNPTLSIEDVYFVLLVFLILCALRFGACGVYSKRFRKVPALIKYLAHAFPIVKEGKVEKFAENAWYAAWHTTSFFIGLIILIQESKTVEFPGWPRLHLKNPDGRWYFVITEAEYMTGATGWPLLQPSATIRYFYLTQLGFWLSCVAYINVETRRSDYYIMWIHHTATLLLVAFSYTCSYWKLGLAIVFLHDVVDIFLYWAKCLNYSVAPPLVVDTTFGAFAVSYFFARLVFFPYYCVLPALNIKLFQQLTQGFVQNFTDVPGGVVLPVCLIVLQILHFYWFYCIIRMAGTMIRSKKQGTHTVDDIRSDDELSDEEVELNKTHNSKKTK